MRYTRVQTITARSLLGLLAALCFLIALGVPRLAEAAEVKHHKVIDFDDEVVEGVNKRPLDSLSHISDAQKRARRPHLYRKRAGFRSETAQTLQTLRYVQ